MNKSQLVVLAIALAAGGGAFMMTGEPGPAPVVQVLAPAPVNLDEVLIATRDLPYGTELGEADLNWVSWPKESLPPGVLIKSAEPNAKEQIKSSYVRIPIASGEPVRRERLVKGVTAGLMSTMVAPGKRAIAIDVTLNSTAGGFILPNDRVDVLRTYRDVEATRDLGHEVYNAEVVLSNVRVLAMGQTIEKKGTEPLVTGSTATLELDPRQAEIVVLAQRTGQLVLSLRPITDAIEKAPTGEGQGHEDDDSITIVKHGLASNVRMK